MAPDITEKKTKNCSKKYAYSAHSKYSKWEKDRRDRFNSKLEDLAQCLPSYTKENGWKKVEIIENAILSIKSRSVNQNKVSEDTIRKLSNEVNNLKNIILQFTGFNESSEDIYRLTSHQISSILSEILMREKEREEASVLPVQVVTSAEKNEKNLAFVAKIAQSNDHCYSMNVSEEISGEVEVVESEVVGGGGPQLAKVVGIVDTVETVDNNSQSQDETILTLVQDGSVVELPQLISFDEPTNPPGAMNCTGNVRTIFVNEAPRPSLLFQPPPPPPPPPLPIPVISEVVNNGRLVSKIAIPRLRLERRKKKVRKTYTRTKPIIRSSKKDKHIFHKDNPEVSDDPLINKEEIEILEETLKEDTEKTEKAALGKEKNVVVTGGEVAKRKLESLSKKKSKSSYSIAALCQISVNIGDRPEIANSPGVMSLNSVGTISPANTPGPPNDTDKTFTLEPGCNIVIGTEPEETVIEELKTIIRPEDVSLLQQIEVTTTPHSVTNISPSSQSYLSSFPLVNKQQQQHQQQQLACEKINQRDIYQALKDLDDIKELQGIEREKSQPRQEKPPPRADKKAGAGGAVVSKAPGKEMVKPDCPQDQSKLSGVKQVVGQQGQINSVMASKISTPVLPTKPSSSKVSSPSTKTVASSALSVYDFSSSKPETPPIPLQESRKDLKSIVKPGGMNQGSCKGSYPTVTGPAVSPDKKSYTELQSKTKKATEEAAKKYPLDNRKSLPDQTVSVIGQQMSGDGGTGGTGGGYLQSNDMMYSETVRHQQHLQDPSMAHRQRSSYNSGYPGPNRQYSTSSSSSSSSSHYPYQAVQHHSNVQPYHHPYNHPDSQHSSAKYSCSAASHSSHSYIHSDFHSRNYYSPTKNYPGPGGSSSSSNVASYRNFNTNEICPVLPPDPFNYKRTSMAASTNQQMNDLGQQIPTGGDKTGPTTSSGTFSVTHLVNSNQRKGSKRTSTGSSKAAKQPRTEAAKESKSEKEEGKRTGRSGSSRRNKSGSRSNYSAESLISSSGATQTMVTSASPCKNQNTKVNQNSAIKTTSNWSNDINHFSGLQLSSLSPSPANLFPTDLSSIDFQMSLFPSDPTTLQTPPGQNTKVSSKQPAACQVATNQRSSTAAVPDWSLNTGILDPSFLPPIPTLTPPSDPMTDPMSGYTFMSPMSHSHSAGFYPTCAQSGSRNQSYSAHSAANISVSGYSTGSKTTNAGHNTFPASQMVSLPPSQTGSLVNFNLSTIFPEINIAPGSQNSLMVPPSLVFSNNPAEQQQ